METGEPKVTSADVNQSVQPKKKVRSEAVKQKKREKNKMKMKVKKRIKAEKIKKDLESKAIEEKRLHLRLKYEVQHLREVNARLRNGTSHRTLQIVNTKPSIQKRPPLLEIDEKIVGEPKVIHENELTFVQETGLKGTFGCIDLYRNREGELVVVKKISSPPEFARCEAKISSLVSSHPNFPIFYGIYDNNRLVMESLGYLQEGNYHSETLLSLQNSKSKELTNFQCFDIALQAVNAIIYFHDIGLLHNDIKDNNIIAARRNSSYLIKIIDFGKVTLKSSPEIYDLSPLKRIKYNSAHRYLAHELRNTSKCPQSPLTDTYSLGYVIKYLGFFSKVDYLLELGRKMKAVNLRERMGLASAREELSKKMMEWGERK